MKRKSVKRPVEPGSAPGHFLGIDTGESRIEVIDYSADNINMRAEPEIAPAERKTVRWIRIAGVPGTATLEQLRDRLDVHPLVLEDIVSAGTRIKLEQYEQYSFTVLRAIGAGSAGQLVETEIDLLLFESTLVTVVHSLTDTLFDPILGRLERQDSFIRHGGADMLYYAVVDLVVDLLFPQVEQIDVAIDELEEQIADNARDEQLADVQQLKRVTQQLRSIAWSTRDVVSHCERTGQKWISDSTRFFFRDVHDHIIHLLDTLGDLKENATGLMELYRSQVNNRTNEVMKVLTIISTLFIPITFIAGVYGMNFVHMPELRFRWAYPIVIGVMLAIASGMLLFFKRRKWF